MRKKLWITLLTLVLCVGAFCVGAGAALVDDTQQPTSIAKSETSYATKYHDTLDEAFRWVRSLGGTVTLLKDLTIDAPLQITANVIDHEHPVVLDLGGHTLSADVPAAESLAGSAVIYMDPATTSRFTVQNGTIQNLADDGIAIYVADGELSLKNMTVPKDIVIQEMYCYYSNIAPKFFSGTFGRIRLDTGNTIRLSKILAKGSYALMGGERLDKDNTYDSLENITFMACDHKDANGEYTLFKDAQTKNGAPAKQCSVCGNFCTHDEITDGPDPQCTACGISIAIKATNLLNGDYIGPWYYTGLDDAMNEILHVHAGRRPVLKLLADTESACKEEWRKISDDGLTIDLAGHTLTLTGNNNKACSEKMKFLNTSDKLGKMLGTVKVYYTGGEMKLTIPDKDNDLTIENLLIGAHGAAELAGGSFGRISVTGGQTLASLLASGYYFAETASGKPAALYNADGNNLTELTNVTVKPCAHDGSTAVLVPGTQTKTGRAEYRCPCGKVTFSASVTKNGATTYYEDIQQAFDAADGGTVKMLVKWIADTLTISGNVTLDLAGQWVQTQNYNCHLAIKGNVTIFADERSALAIPVTVGNGGTLTVPKERNGVENKRVIDDFLTVETGGKVTVNGGSIEVIVLKKDSTAAINGGTIDSLRLINQSAAAISGGSFGSIQIYETYFDENGQQEEVWAHEVTYADFAALLTDGKAFKLTDSNTWANDSNVEIPYSTSAKSKEVKNITVADAPIKKLAITGENSVQYGRAAVLTANMDAGENAVTYQWYQVTDSGRTAIDGAVDSTYAVPTSTLGSYTYVVAAACDGYQTYSEPFAVTVIPRVLKLPIIEAGTDTKVYDGTTDTALKITGFSDETGNTVPLTEGVEFTLDSAAYENPSVIEKGNDIQYTITLKNPNYTFTDGVTMTVLSGGHITQATAPKAEYGSLTVANDQSAVYTFDFKSLMPALDESKTYGTVSYTLGDVRLPNYYDYANPAAELNDGVLTLPIKASDTTNTGGMIGRATVRVTTQNYEEFPLTMAVIATNKKLPILTGEISLSRTAFTYGEMLSAAEISGTMQYNGSAISGTFAWQEPDAKLPAGSHTVGWVFTPTDTDAYLTATGTANITVNKAVLTGEPAYTSVTQAGKTIADVPLTENKNWPAGTIMWVQNGTDAELSPATEIKANTAYEWLFTPYDTANYESLRGKLTPYRVSTGGGGSVSAPTYKPSVTPTTGGTTAVSNPNPKKGDTVTIMPKPDAGNEVAKVIVTDKNGKTVEVKANADGTYSFTQPDSSVKIEVVYQAKTPAQPDFADVSREHFAYDAVKWAQEKGITGGIGDNRFGTNLPCTRGQIVTFLWRAAGSPEPKNADGFSDVSESSYYAKAVAWAVENGITAGTGDGKFSPEDICTRAQSVTFLFRAAKASADGTPDFRDVAGDAYYAEAVKWAADNGITNGIGNGLFGPDNTCTRAQIVTFLWKLYAGK